MKPVLNRRELLMLSGGAAVGAVASAASATPAAADVSELLAVGAGRTVVLQDRRLPLPDELQERLSGNGARLLPLDEDPVRMWRGEHAALLDHADTRLLGVTPWIEFVMIQGLAAESRRRVRYQRFDAGSNAMVWLIA
jgi:hypothetical protein